MKKNDLDYLGKRIGILGARMEKATPKASFYNEMAQERAALKRICSHLEKPCKWTDKSSEYESSYSTGCGSAFEFEAEGIEEHGFKFCPFCGGRIEAEY
jgi:hypothetical protein